MNEGKKFEASFKASVPDKYLLYRLPDPAQSFGGNTTLRFTVRNPFDFLLWDAGERYLFALELKTVAGKSISFERSKEEHGEIHYYQIEGLNRWSAYDGIISGFIIEFRSLETTIFVGIKEFEKLIGIIDKKSFTIQDLENNEIPYIDVPQHKIRSRYRYDVESFVDRAKKEVKENG